MTRQPTPTIPQMQIDRLTYSELLVIVSRVLGVGLDDSDGVSTPPTDKGDLARCRRIITRSLRRWQTSNPAGWGVQSQFFDLTLDGTGSSVFNVGGDPAKYHMPWSFTGKATGEWYDTYGGWSCRVVTMEEFNKVNTQLDAQSTAAQPRRCVFTHYEFDAPTGQRDRGWVVQFYPTPSGSRTLRIAYEASVVNMFFENDTFFAGHPYDRSIEAVCLFEAASEARRDTETMARYEQEMRVSLAEAVQYDRETAPAIIGRLSSNEEIGDFGYSEGFLTGDVTFNGIDLGRFGSSL